MRLYGNGVAAGPSWCGTASPTAAASVLRSLASALQHLLRLTSQAEHLYSSQWLGHNPFLRWCCNSNSPKGKGPFTSLHPRCPRLRKVCIPCSQSRIFHKTNCSGLQSCCRANGMPKGSPPRLVTLQQALDLLPHHSFSTQANSTVSALTTLQISPEVPLC